MKTKINFSARLSDEAGQFMEWLGKQNPPWNRSTVIRQAVKNESRTKEWKKRGWSYSHRAEAKNGRRDPYGEEI